MVHSKGTHLKKSGSIPQFIRCLSHFSFFWYTVVHNQNTKGTHLKEWLKSAIYKGLSHFIFSVHNGTQWYTVGTQKVHTWKNGVKPIIYKALSHFSFFLVHSRYTLVKNRCTRHFIWAWGYFFSRGTHFWGV